MFDIYGTEATAFVYLVLPPKGGSVSLRKVVSNVLKLQVKF